MRTYSLDNLTLLGVSLPELVEVAAAAGYRSISPWAMAMTDGRMTSLPRNGDLRAMADRLRDTGVQVAAGDGFVLLPGHDLEQYEESASHMAELGASNIVVLPFDDEPARGFESFCRLSEHAGSLGMGVALEFLPTSQVTTLNTALAYIARTGMSHVGLQVDFFHVMNGAGSVDELASVDPALIRCAQISDGNLGLSLDEYAHAMRADRAAPGDGEFPLVDLLRLLPTDINVGVEVPRSPPPDNRAERESYAGGLRRKLDRVLVAAGLAES